MSKLTKKFIVAKRNIKISDAASVEKDDVGIIESESKKHVSALFIRVGKGVKLNKGDFEIFDFKKTGDAFPKKICNVCHKLLDTNQFDRNQNAKNNRSVRRPSCRSCRKIIEGVRLKPKFKREWLKRKPDIESFKCPICGKRTIAGVTSKVVLDHDRNTGKPRAWICDSCNTGIGRFRDDVKILRRVTDFLKVPPR